MAIVGAVIGCASNPPRIGSSAIDGGPADQKQGDAPLTLARIPVPLTIVVSAFDRAAAPSLEEFTPIDHEDLHNVVRLSENIISGSEPEGIAALEKIAAMGVKTLLSVDGKTPDAETAVRLGMRYVHVPIQYKGITDVEMLRIAKTFRELEAPFYVHCYHGKHRGPAAAALGRVLLDGASRDQAIAEMRQWCGTSADYEGLYRAIATGDFPGVEETTASDYSFPSAFELTGLRHSMTEICRIFDNLTIMKKVSWKIEPSHPDLDPAHEADRLTQILTRTSELSDMAKEPDDLQRWMVGTIDVSAELRDLLKESRLAGIASLTPNRVIRIDTAYTALDASCKTCHRAYRNE